MFKTEIKHLAIINQMFAFNVHSPNLKEWNLITLYQIFIFMRNIIDSFGKRLRKNMSKMEKK